MHQDKTKALSPRVGDCAWLFRSESRLPTLECLPTYACNRLSHLLQLQSDNLMAPTVQYAMINVTKHDAKKLNMQYDDTPKFSKLERLLWCIVQRATCGTLSSWAKASSSPAGGNKL